MFIRRSYILYLILYLSLHTLHDSFNKDLIRKSASMKEYRYYITLRFIQNLMI